MPSEIIDSNVGSKGNYFNVHYKISLKFIPLIYARAKENFPEKE
jgi:hypothetical protein